MWIGTITSIKVTRELQVVQDFTNRIKLTKLSTVCDVQVDVRASV